MGQSIKTWLTIVSFYLHAYFSLANEHDYLHADHLRCNLLIKLECSQRLRPKVLTEVFHFLWMRNEERDHVYSMGRSSTVNVNCNVLYNVKK